MENGSIEMTVGGRKFRITVEAVESSLRGLRPERVQSHALDFNGQYFPVKQAFEAVTGLDRLDFTTEQARSAFRRLGLEVRRVS